MSKKLSYEEFLERAYKRHGDKYIYDDETVKCFDGSHSYIPIICPKHGKFWVCAKSHLKYECERCSYEKRGKMSRSNSSEFIEKAKKIHGDKYDYSKVEYIDAHTKVCIICPIHGEFWQTPNVHLNGRGCSKCNDSHLERELSFFFDKNNVEYERGKQFEWLGKQSLDFYLPKYKIGIECQGKQHIGLGGWSDNYDFSKEYEFDERKNRLCFENGVDLIYFCEKVFYNHFFGYEIYNKDNVFYDLNDLFERIKKVRLD